jgi:ESCRT-II complex subunit VPS25
MIYWRRPEEWAERLAAWVARTGQSRSIVTFFEILEGDEAGEWQPPLPRPCT